MPIIKNRKHDHYGFHSIIIHLIAVAILALHIDGKRGQETHPIVRHSKHLGRGTCPHVPPQHVPYPHVILIRSGRSFCLADRFFGIFPAGFRGIFCILCQRRRGRLFSEWRRQTSCCPSRSLIQSCPRRGTYCTNGNASSAAPSILSCHNKSAAVFR